RPGWGRMTVVGGCARQFELAARLEGDRAASGHVEHADDVVTLHDRLPAEQVAHAVEQRVDAALAGIRHWPVISDGEGELLVLGADTELRFWLAARFEPGDELVTRLDGRHVDLVTSHAALHCPRAQSFPKTGDYFSVSCGQKGRDLKHGNPQRAM